MLTKLSDAICFQPAVVAKVAIGIKESFPYTCCFGSNGYGSPSKKEPAVMPAIQALSTTPANRDVRVHDARYHDEISLYVQTLREERQ